MAYLAPQYHLGVFYPKTIGVKGHLRQRSQKHQKQMHSLVIGTQTICLALVERNCTTFMVVI